MPQVLDGLDGSVDTYMSQASFFRPNRCAVNLWRLPLSFIDLDIYKAPGVIDARWTPERACQVALRWMADHGVPEPSLVISSGRGLYTKWLFTGALPQAALSRWNAVQRELLSRLTPLGADPQARDCSRVLRLVRTVNSKADAERRVVRVLHVAGDCDSPLRYSFDALADAVLPLTRAECQALWAQKNEARASRQLELIEGGRRERGCRRGSTGSQWAEEFTLITLKEARFVDLRRLISLRGSLDEGMRERALFALLNEGLAAGIIDAARAFHEARALAVEVNPNFTYGTEWSQGDLSRVISRGKAQAAGLADDDGRLGLYRFRTATLIQYFQITSEEMRHMSVLIDRAEKDRRWNERRRDDRGAERRRADQSMRSLTMRAEGATQREIAAALGLSERHVRRVLKGK